MRHFFSIILFIFIPFMLFSQEYEQGFIDTVYQFTPGVYIEEVDWQSHFPQNIFGQPSDKATIQVPASATADVLPFGIGGEIIVGFKGKALFNGPGYDFIIFENAFLNPINKGIFAEPAKVAVSQDGINFIEFPYDTETLEGLAGLTPVIGTKDPFIHPACGGDAFDLDDVGLSFITHIKLTDFTDIILTLDTKHKYYNPEHILSGFDLDAVSARYLADASLASIIQYDNKYDFTIHSNYDYIQVISNESNINLIASVFDIFGRKMNSHNFSDYLQIPISGFSSGIYLMQISDSHGQILSIYKFVKL
ncbi:MAG: hypothetical protein CVV22_09895 [Ignavibacteriae bacterium HGW-Ignavibacteriae-1]|nr:MAG: hypothetical protein CVV22_09895 [Ignavibacteriae bacterium HGW-Ignavibacteriae-1]